jgi:hypothetical protein
MSVKIEQTRDNTRVYGYLQRSQLSCPATNLLLNILMVRVATDRDYKNKVNNIDRNKFMILLRHI